MRAKIVARPDEYQWSSLYYLLNKKAAHKDVSWYRAGDMLELVGGKDGLVNLISGGDTALPVVYGKFISEDEIPTL